MHVVYISIRTRPEDVFLGGAPIGRPRKFLDLASAKRFVDRKIKELTVAGTTIEVRELDGRAKYRVERCADGKIKRYRA